MRLRDLSIRHQVMLVLLAASAATAVFVTAGFVTTEPPALRTELRQQLAERAEGIDVQSGRLGLRDRWRRPLGVAGGVLAVALLLAVVLAIPLQRVLSQPVLELVATANAVAARKDYSVRARRAGAGAPAAGAPARTRSHPHHRLQP